MARKPKLAATEPQGVSEATAAPETFEVEFPAEVIQAATHEAALTTPTEEAKPLEEVVAATPAIEEPPAPASEPAPEEIAAAETPPPKPGSLLAQIEEGRRQYKEVQERLAALRAGGLAAKDYEFQLPADLDPDQDPDLKTAFRKTGNVLGKQLLEHFQTTLRAELGRAQAEFTARNVVRSNATWSRMLPDYKDVVIKSGVNQMLELDAGGKPKYPDKFDPVVRQVWLQSAEPALYAYELGKEILNSAPKKSEAKPAEGRGTVTPIAHAAQLRAKIEMEAVERASERPQSIQSLPASSGGAKRVINSVRDLTDAEKKYLMDNKPEVWNALKRQAVGL